MHPLRRQRLLTVIFIIVASSVVIGLLLYAARDSINLFYEAAQQEGVDHAKTCEVLEYDS